MHFNRPLKHGILCLSAVYCGVKQAAFHWEHIDCFWTKKWMRTLCSIHVGRTGKLWHFSLMTQNFIESCESFEVGTLPKRRHFWHCRQPAWCPAVSPEGASLFQIFLHLHCHFYTDVFHTLCHLMDFICLLVGIWMSAIATSTSHNKPARLVHKYFSHELGIERHTDRQVDR